MPIGQRGSFFIYFIRELHFPIPIQAPSLDSLHRVGDYLFCVAVFLQQLPR